MASKQRVDSAELVIGASAEAVYAAFADPTAWERWLPPTDQHWSAFNAREFGEIC